jgi:hypothetical protein
MIEAARSNEVPNVPEASPAEISDGTYVGTFFDTPCKIVPQGIPF